MRRRVTLKTTLRALIAAPLLLAAWPALVPVHAADAPFISIVTGLAPDDLLNVRARPSPIGKTEARLAAGASVRNLGCSDVDGHSWCKVESDNPKASGWTPARYLNPVNPAVLSSTDQPADAPAVAATTDTGPKPGAAPPADGPATETPPPATPSVAGAAPASEPAGSVAAPAPAEPPPDLTARLGGVPHPAAPEAPKSPAATAMQDAYGLALAAQDNPTTSEIRSPAEAPAPAPMATATVTPPAEVAAPEPDASKTDASKTGEQPVQEAAAGPSADPPPGDGTAGDGGAANGIPVPTPRPGSTEAQLAVDPQTVARVEASQPSAHAPDATGEIPCARYVGQPMTRCAVSVVRSDNKADVTVTWPDGGTRIISFYAGQPAGSNSRSDFRFTREGTLNMIRVGVSERFEITDQLALGD